MPSVQGVVDGSTVGGDGLVSTSTQETAVSAVKRHEERDTLVVRLTNLIGRPVEETLAFGADLDGAWRVDLHESRLDALPVAGDRRVGVTLRPYEILTVEVQPRA